MVSEYVIGAIIFAVALIGIFLARTVFTRTTAGAIGRMLYIDDGTEKVLYDYRNRVAGRPDKVINVRGFMFRSEARPYSFKTSKAPAEPHPHHVAQVMVEGLLVEANWGEYPKFGYIEYEGSKTMRIKLGRASRAYAIEIVKRMHQGKVHLKQVPVTARCKGCPFRKHCSYV